LSATDGDLPVQTLTYSLVNGPEGLTVSAGGAVAWTPTVAQGPGSYDVVVRVNDSGNPTASADTGFSIVVAPPLVAVGIRINEVMSSNLETLLDADSDPSDWIELMNPESFPINLVGYGLSDNPAVPFKWVFPNVILDPGQHLLVFASEKDLRPEWTGALHTSFKIGSSGDTIILTAPAGGLVDQVSVPALGKDVSYGRLTPTQSVFRYFKPATPGTGNEGPGFEGMLPTPSLTVTPGFYATPVSVSATFDGTEGVTLRYTLDGNEPTETSPVLSAAVTLQGRAGEPNLWANIPTADDNYLPLQPKWGWSQGAGWDHGPLAETYKINTFRVRAFKNGQIPSRTASGSYIVDPVGANRYQLPVVSIMADYDSLFGASRGLFVPFNYTEDGILWERPAHMEIFENQSLGLEQDIGIRVHGGGSTRARLKSLRIYARSQYGPDQIDYPIFTDRSNNIHERLILRSGGTDWAGVAFRDAFAQSLLKDISDVTIQYHRAAVVFINGEYWGIEGFRDRLDDNYLKVQFGVSEIDLLGGTGEVEEGSNAHYLNLVSYLTAEDLNAPGRYDWVKSQMDVDNFRDYQIAQSFYMNVDQPGKNVEFWRSQVVDPGNPYADGRWRWLLFDVDVSMRYGSYAGFERNALVYNTGLNDIDATTVNPVSTSPTFAPNTPEATLVLRRMLSNLEFRQSFITRAADLLNTVFAPPYTRARLQEFKSEVEPYMPEHIARWGFPASMSEWQGLISTIDTFVDNRPSSMRQHLQDFFHLSGTNRVTVDVAVGGSGKVKVNTIVVGPGEPGMPAEAFPWSGIYFSGLPVTVRAVALPGYEFSHWTGDVPSGQETTESLTMTLSGDVSLTAVFAPVALPVLRQYWSFNETNALLQPQVGAGNGLITVSGGVAADVLPSTGQGFDAVNANAQMGELAGTHLRVNNPLGKEMIVRLPTRGVEDAVVKYETRRSGQGAGTQVIAYTTDGTAWVPLQTVAIADGNPALVTLDFSGIAETDNNADFALRITFEQGAGGTSGNNRFDNLTVNARTLPGYGAAGFPVLTGVPVQTVNEQTGLSLNLAGTDPDAAPDTLSYALVSGPPGLTVSGAGLVEWTPGETLGGTTHPVVVRVRDNSAAGLSSLGRINLSVLEANVAPVLAGVSNQTLDELSALSLNLSATDTDLPVQTLTYSLVNGPEGLTVSGGGSVVWIPTEDQGPGSYEVVVRVTDNGHPTASSDITFSIVVNEVVGNTPPQLAAVGNQGVDETEALTLSLSATDSDLPAQTLTYSLVSGPEGLTVSGAGAVAWTPTEAQGPGGYEVVVRVTDSGHPTASADITFTVVVNEVADPISRTVWQIGTDNSPTVSPYKPAAEFSQENNRNDLRPGRVTRLAGDPEYVALTNPKADDDFYFAGSYPVGFNGLISSLIVPNDEPPAAWERAHTANDRTNRLHFVLAAGQVTDQSTFQLSFELVNGGSLMGGVVQPGFADHDIAVNFRNPAGVITQLFSQRVSQSTNIVIQFAASTVGALAGANTLEIVRTGPAVSGVSYWIQYDYLRLESSTEGNAAPMLDTPPNQVVDELVPMSFALSATDSDVPAQTLTYSRVSGPEGLSVSPTGLVTWTPTEAQGAGTYTVEVLVTDNGFPARSDAKQFTVQVNEVVDPVARTVWQIGIDNNPAVLPYRPTAEFSPENNRNDLPPGRVTRLTGDPQYAAATNPTADDDFYFAGTYPAGFNGLLNVLNVPNDEPSIAWERSQTGNDRTNRIHFILDPAQVDSGSAYRFSFELVFGGSSIGGVVQPGFGEHDMVVRFRNSAGVTFPLFTQRVTQTTNVVIHFTAAAVGAMAGPNSIEIVRTGPVVSGVSYWINNDYWRLENLSNGPAPTGGLALARVSPSPLDSDSEGVGASLVPSAPGVLRLGFVTLEDREYLTVTFDQAESPRSGTQYVVESTTDLIHWEEAPAVVLSIQSSGHLRTTTLQDTVPMDSSDRRFLRVRLLPDSGTSAE
jgi:hypothetical protein